MVEQLKRPQQGIAKCHSKNTKINLKKALLENVRKCFSRIFSRVPSFHRDHTDFSQIYIVIPHISQISHTSPPIFLTVFTTFSHRLSHGLLTNFSQISHSWLVPAWNRNLWDVRPLPGNIANLGKPARKPSCLHGPPRIDKQPFFLQISHIFRPVIDGEAPLKTL